MNLNYIPYFTTFKREAQYAYNWGGTDISVVPDAQDGIAQVYTDAGFKFDGTKAMPADFLKPVPGLHGYPVARPDGLVELPFVAGRACSAGLRIA